MTYRLPITNYHLHFFLKHTQKLLNQPKTYLKLKLQLFQKKY